MRGGLLRDEYLGGLHSSLINIETAIGRHI